MLLESFRLRLGVYKGMKWNDHKGMEMNEICGGWPRIIWPSPRPVRGPVLPRRHRGSGNPYLGPLGQREYVRGVIPPRTLQNPDQRCVQATVVHPSKYVKKKET